MALPLLRREVLPPLAFIILCLLASWAPPAKSQSDANCPLNSSGYAMECDPVIQGAPTYSSNATTGTFSSESALYSAIQTVYANQCFPQIQSPPWAWSLSAGATSATYQASISVAWVYTDPHLPPCTGTQTPYSGTVYGGQSVPLSCPAGYLSGSGLFPLGYCWIYVVQLDQTQKICWLCIGNPLNPETGNKHQEETDYTGTGPVPLEFRRIYNSGTQYFTRAVPLGNYWRTTYSRWITYYVQGSTEIATINRPEGSFSFTLSGSAWVPDADVNYKLAGTAGAFKVTTPDGRDVEFYRGDGQLSSVKTVSGTVKYTLTYNAATPAQLTQVSDPFGHTLSFTYDTQKRLATMTDPNGKLTQYGYDANNNLTTVTYPDSAIRTYVYNESGYTGGANLPAALTGIVDESSTRFAYFGYDATGLAVLSEHAGGADRYAVSYGTPPQFCPPNVTIDVTHHIKYLTTCWVPPAGVTVTDPLGTVRSYGFTGILGGIRPTGADQPCTGSCTSVPASQSFDANGNVASETDFNGNITTRLFDLTRNLETSRVEASGTSSARTITTTWNASFRLPATIAEANRITTFTYDANGNVLTKTITDTTVSPHPRALGPTPTTATIEC